MPRASGLAASIRDQLDVDPELVRGDNGIFDVVADGSMVFSKDAEGRFPEEEEVIDSLRRLRG